VDTTAEAGLLEMTKTTATSQNLSFDDIFHLSFLSKLFCHEESLFSVECNVSQRDRNTILV
jgi:hypothetical protein